MTLILKCFLADYKRFWFKTIISLLGLVISLSLYTVIELYVGLLSQQNSEKVMIISDNNYKLLNQTGFISAKQIQLLLDSKLISSITPFNEKRDKLTINGVTQTVSIFGLDKLSYMSKLSRTKSVQKDQAFPSEFSPFDLKQGLLLSSKAYPKDSTFYSIAAQQELKIASFQQANQGTPILIVDMALFHSLYPQHQATQSLLLSSDINIDSLSNKIKVIDDSLILRPMNSRVNDKSKWTNSLIFNLKFLALIAMALSTTLLIQFYRFLGFQRLKQARLLFQLGISKQRLAKVIVLESFLLAIIVFILSIFSSLLITRLSLDMFNQLVSTFYFYMDANAIQVDDSLLLKVFIILLVSLGIATLSIIQKLFVHTISISTPTVIFLTVMFFSTSIALIHYPLGHSTGIYVPGLFLLSGFFCSAFLLVLLLARSLSKISRQSFLQFKMGQASIQKDPLSYALITFIIALSLGLIICMGTFVNSFRTSVSTWLNIVIQHDIYIQHNANDIQFPAPIPKTVLEQLETIQNDAKAYHISRIPFIYKETPIQLQIIDTLKENDKSLFKEGPKWQKNITNIFITEPFAIKQGIHLGDTISIAPLYPKELYIAGIIYDYTSEFGSITMSRHDFESDKGPVQRHGVALALNSNQETDSVYTLLNQLSHRGDLLIQPQKEFKDRSIQVFNDTFRFSWFMVLMITGISILCLSNLLTMICIDRQKELSQLYLIGFNTSRLFKLVFIQLLLITGLGIFISFFLGFSLYYYLIYGIQLPTFSWSIFISVPWSFIFINTAITLIMSLLVSRLFFSLNTPLFIRSMSND